MFFAIAGNDCGKTIAVAQSTAKTVKVFPLERFALYGITHAETFPDLTPLLKMDSFEGFLNRCKINGMVNDNLSSCNFLKIKK